MARRVVMVDGEGFTREDGSHDYVMITGRGLPPLRNPGNTPLTTLEILGYLWTMLEPGDLNVIYGGSYDFNMWVKGSQEDQLRKLYKGGFRSKGVQYGPYTCKWVKGKSFTISRNGRTVVIYDTVAFFQQPFVSALDGWLGKDGYEGRDFLIAQKAARGKFDPADADRISEYNQTEVEVGSRLIEELRERLDRVNLRPAKWYGPGALAGALYQREKIKEHMAESPPEVARAAQYAYAGGRFEMFQYGTYEGKVWEYDINSAYPAAMGDLPSLSHGRWVHHPTPLPVDVSGRFTVYRVRYSDGVGNPRNPHPFYLRLADGSICYPPHVTGWYWSPEIRAAHAYTAKYGGTVELLESWEFVPDPGAPKPFAFVAKLYAERQVMKRQKDGAQLALKLVINSLYGKVAQQVGWSIDKAGKLHKPPYHQLEWAGYITSFCRARILTAITQDRDAIISTETDALFSTRPLDLPVNDGLGAWEETIFTSMDYVQSGVYFATKDTGEEVVKMRGVDRGWVPVPFATTRAAVQATLTRPLEDRVLPAPLTRFKGAGVALQQDFSQWCRWTTDTKHLRLYPTGKRVHYDCPTCARGAIRGLHRTAVPVSGGESYAYPVAWVDDKSMREVEETAQWRVEAAREGEYDYLGTLEN